MTLDEIEVAVRAQNGHWAPFFRRHGAGWHCILYPRHILTDEEYQALAARLRGSSLIRAPDTKAGGLVVALLLGTNR